jgi:hypothetical protein
MVLSVFIPYPTFRKCPLASALPAPERTDKVLSFNDRRPFMANFAANQQHSTKGLYIARLAPSDANISRSAARAPF